MVLVLLVDRGEHVLAVELGQGSGDGGCTDSEHACNSSTVPITVDSRFRLAQVSVDSFGARPCEP